MAAPLNATSFDYTIPFNPSIHVPTILDLSKIIFSIILVVFTTSISLKYALGEGTSKYSRAFQTLLILMLVVVQYYHLWFALLTVPVDFDDNRSKPAHRFDCLNSEKGGKRARGDESTKAKNPCFAHMNSTCKLADDTIILINSTNATVQCIADESAENKFNGEVIERYLSDSRDCGSARGDECSMSQPCTPCELSRAEEFGDRWTRCTTCSSRNRGNCRFVEGVGPYCYKGAYTREVVPCRSCCTDGDTAFDFEGVCT